MGKEWEGKGENGKRMGEKGEEGKWIKWLRANKFPLTSYLI